MKNDRDNSPLFITSQQKKKNKQKSAEESYQAGLAISGFWQML